VLTSEQARELLDSIDVSTLVGLRDRALIAVMTFAFERIGAVVAMRVEDYFPKGKRWWVRLHEKGGKRHEMPAHHNLEAYLDAYIEAAGVGDNGRALLFRSAVGRTGVLTDKPLNTADRFAFSTWATRRRKERVTAITSPVASSLEAMRAQQRIGLMVSEYRRRISRRWSRTECGPCSPIPSNS
jgi:site-specific recombinase XerC